LRSVSGWVPVGFRHSRHHAAILMTHRKSPCRLTTRI
jgi:hypothetical protein